MSDHIWIFDNEPRNREIVARISKAIERGDKVVLLLTKIKEKDINDMHLAGHDVQTLVESNVYQGLEATLKFNTWKRKYDKRARYQGKEAKRHCRGVEPG